VRGLDRRLEGLLRFRGVIPILQTPFDESETIDRAALVREVEFACNAGADAIAFPGFASEWWKLTEAEIDCAAEIVLTAAAARVPVNITAQATCHAVEAARRFTRMGCQRPDVSAAVYSGNQRRGGVPSPGRRTRSIAARVYAAVVAITRRKRNRMTVSG